LSISFGVKVLNLVEQDLLAIPSIAELHEVWDFLSINSQVTFFFYGRLLRGWVPVLKLPDMLDLILL
jgi:hypothetical protein